METGQNLKPGASGLRMPLANLVVDLLELVKLCLLDDGRRLAVDNDADVGGVYVRRPRQRRLAPTWTR